MMASNPIAQFLQQILFHVPGLVIGAVGLTLVILGFAKLRSAALPATIGCALYLFAHLLQPIFYSMLVPPLAGQNPQTIGTILLVANFLFSGAYTVSFGLLIWAALAGRSDGPQKPPFVM